MYAEPALTREALAQRWRELLADRDAPDFCELDEHGEVIVNPPPSRKHQSTGLAVIEALHAQPGPRAIYEVGVLTDRGVFVPDVIWMPPERWKQAGDEEPLPFVPDICVEVLSPSNTRVEITRKVEAYLRGGAREVMIIGMQGNVDFFGPEGRRAQSALGVVLNLPREAF
jgi:Uma2 family endonuclease